MTLNIWIISSSFFFLKVPIRPVPIVFSNPNPGTGCLFTPVGRCAGKGKGVNNANQTPPIYPNDPPTTHQSPNVYPSVSGGAKAGQVWRACVCVVGHGALLLSRHACCWVGVAALLLPCCWHGHGEGHTSWKQPTQRLGTIGSQHALILGEEQKVTHVRMPCYRAEGRRMGKAEDGMVWWCLPLPTPCPTCPHHPTKACPTIGRHETGRSSHRPPHSE